MKLLKLTLPSCAENLAIDEALLDHLADADSCGEVLRLWEPEVTMVVIGRSSKIDDEVDREYCSEHGIEVLRRSSGGASIVSGPGCLMYAVVLDLKKRPELRALDAAHCFVLRNLRAAINACGGDVSIQGTSDLTIGNRKFSGNALRLTRHGLLYHGTLLNRFDISLIPKCLKTPPRQPDYRQQRSHTDFLTNINLDSHGLNSSIAKQWQANTPLENWPETRTRSLVKNKYSLEAWNERS